MDKRTNRKWFAGEKVGEKRKRIFLCPLTDMRKLHPQKTISLVIKIARFPKKINAFPRQNQIFSKVPKGGLFFIAFREWRGTVCCSGA